MPEAGAVSGGLVRAGTPEAGAVVPAAPKLGCSLEADTRDRKEKRDLIKEATSTKHLMDHSQFNPYCAACVWARTQAKGTLIKEA